MAKRKRTLWDDLLDIGRDLRDRVDELLQQDDKRRKPARVPVPIPVNQPRRDPYER